MSNSLPFPTTHWHARVFQKFCLYLTFLSLFSLFLPEEEATALPFLTQRYWRQPCVLNDSLLLLYFFLSRYEILVTISESKVPRTGGIKYALCFCYVWLLEAITRNKSQGIRNMQQKKEKEDTFISYHTAPRSNSSPATITKHSEEQAQGLPTWKIIMLWLKKVIIYGLPSRLRVIQRCQGLVWFMEPWHILLTSRCKNTIRTKVWWQWAYFSTITCTEAL